ncbi:LSU ribosomal protein L29p (L35e) [hydrothermal vent metagenome]|uniref:Large ribosomal subunit protein uL29 n=1 Tax=hydrothermal vent metagenome TaxID=652676 RepID=A0A1W1BKL9_9ZZZZ
MLAKDLREKGIEELKVVLLDLLKDHFSLRMEHRSGQLSDTSKLAKTKKTIARVKTIIREKQV